MLKNYLGFDLEIVKEIPEGADWKDIRPLGISCAATIATGQEDPTIYYHGQYDSPISGAMEKSELLLLLEEMEIGLKKGYLPLTWNGLQFDFPVLAEESGEWDRCRELALKSVDMMFHFFCDKGYPLGLDTAAKHQGLSGKMEGMSGKNAPKKWAESLETRHMVLGYVGRDARITLDLADVCERQRYLGWVSRSGRSTSFILPDKGWLTVEECLELPLPDQSWMSEPILRESFTSWLK